LAICLNHPQSQLRIEALQRLREGIQSKQVFFFFVDFLLIEQFFSSVQNIEQEFLLDVILSRLNDNDVKVVHETIRLLEETDLSSNSSINDRLEKLLQRDKDEWTNVQQTIVRYMTRNSSDDRRFVHLLFPSNSSEIQLLQHLLDAQKSSLTPLMKLAKKYFKNVQQETFVESFDKFLRSIDDHDDRTSIFRSIFDQQEEIFRLMDSSRPNWIKFAVIFILLGLEAMKISELTEFSVRMILKLLQKLSKEVSRTFRFRFRLKNVFICKDFGDERRRNDDRSNGSSRSTRRRKEIVDEFELRNTLEFVSSRFAERRTTIFVLERISF
jgi:hypothetical protein